MELMRDPFLIFEVFGIAGILFFIYAGVLAFFLPFYVMGIYNQTKAVNKTNIPAKVLQFPKKRNKSRSRSCELL